MSICPRCNGKGLLKVEGDGLGAALFNVMAPFCPTCNGRGYIPDEVHVYHHRSR